MSNVITAEPNMKALKEIKDWSDVVEFKDEYGQMFKKDNRARASLNKTLDTNFKAVFRSQFAYSEQWKAGDVDWCGETVYVLTHKDKVVRFTNSEWASFKGVK